MLAADSGNDSFSWGTIGDFFKWLFVPEGDYFVTKSSELSAHVNQKLGGVAELYWFLNDFFKALGGVSPSRMQVTLPNNFWMKGSPGFSFDLFGTAAPVISVIRSVTTCLFCLLTGIACYHKLRKFFRE